VPSICDAKNTTHLLGHLFKLALHQHHALPVAGVPDVAQVIDALAPESIPTTTLSICFRTPQLNAQPILACTSGPTCHVENSSGCESASAASNAGWSPYQPKNNVLFTARQVTLANINQDWKTDACLGGFEKAACTWSALGEQHTHHCD
jgi:hypothetical protein